MSSMASENALCGSCRACGAGVRLNGLSQGSGKRLEPAFGDMMGIVAVQCFEVNAGAGMHGECVMEFLEQFGVHFANFRAAESHVPNKIGSVGEVDNAARQRLVHGDERG